MSFEVEKPDHSLIFMLIISWASYTSILSSSPSEEAMDIVALFNPAGQIIMGRKPLRIFIPHLSTNAGDGAIVT